MDVRLAERRHLRTAPSARVRDRLVPDRSIACAPCWCTPDMTGSPTRSKSTRPTWWRGARTPWRTTERQEGPGRCRRRAPRASGLVGAAWPCSLMPLRRRSSDSSPRTSRRDPPSSPTPRRATRQPAGTATFTTRSKSSAAESPRISCFQVASLTTRWVAGTHQGSVSDPHLQSCLNEFVFRFDRRRSGSRGLVFYRVLELALDHDPVRC